MILASQTDHCLADLIWRWRQNEQTMPNQVDVAAAPAPRRQYNTHYLAALAAKARPKARRKYVKIHCKTFAGGLKALLRAFGEQV